MTGARPVRPPRRRGTGVAGEVGRAAPVRASAVLVAPVLAALLAACAPEDGAPPSAPAEHPAAAPAASPAAARPAGDPPRFEDYPVAELHDGPPAPVDLMSHPRARRFRTALRRGAAGGPNFAGHYTVVSWGCGTMCVEFMVVDAVTGRVFDGYAHVSPPRVRLDSRLLVLEAPEPVPGAQPCAACTESYLLWEDGGLELVPPESWIVGAPAPITPTTSSPPTPLR